MLPNDISLSKFRNFNLLLGPNYSGKSTLLAQVGLLCVMAQAGLFVPAKGMIFNPFGNILTHLTGCQDIYSTSSSLMLEAQV
jgi:DNA mismatch repair protein MutS